MAKITLVAIDLAHPEDIEEILVKAETLADISGTKLAVITVIPDFGMSMVGAFFEPDTMAKALEKAANPCIIMSKNFWVVGRMTFCMWWKKVPSMKPS